MNDQLDLFSWAARSGDPSTSHLAAEHIRPSLSRLRRMFLETLARIGPATANEVAWAATEDHTLRESIRKRAAEVVKTGEARIVAKRSCKVTGMMANVYELEGC